MPQAKDPIDEFLALPRDKQESLLPHMSSEAKQRVADRVTQLEKTRPGGATGSWVPPDIAQRFQQQYPRLSYPFVALAQLGRGATEAAENLVGTPSAIYHAITDPLTPQELADPTYTDVGSTLTNPIRRLFLEPQFAQLEKARTAIREQRPAAAAAHLAATFPVVGPLAGEIGERAASGDIPGAAGEALTYYLAPKITGEATGAAMDQVGRLRERARAVVQGATGASPFRTTGAAVERANKAIARTAEKQRAVTAADEAFNKAQEARAAAKNAELEARHRERVAESERQAAEKNAAAREKTKQQLEQARQVTESNARAESIDRSLREGSERLGNQVKDLDSQVRAEANEKYDAVRNAVKDDPGVPLADLATAAKYAEGNILKGSAENIKHFRELARKAPEEAGVRTSVGELQPGDPLYERLKSEGVLDLGGDVPFDQLQGYSSEIGEKLARGNLPGDVYRALKYLKDTIDTAKTTIADRNGAGAALRNADAFWRSYMDLFYDADSALAKVRESVGALDPEFYADPFTKGKAAEVAISKLKSMKSRHASELSGIADLARNLRSAARERDNIRTAKVPGVEKPTLTEPKSLEPPQTVTPKTRAPRTVPQPREATPTATDIIEAKRRAVIGRGLDLQQLRPRDAYILATSIFGGLLGHDMVRSLTYGLVGEGTLKGLGYLLTRPQIVEWIARPVPEDLVLADKLPEAARVKLRAELQSVIDQERAAGRPISVSPSVTRFLTQAGVSAVPASRLPANRAEALERLGRNPAQPMAPARPPAQPPARPRSAAPVQMNQPEPAGATSATAEDLSRPIEVYGPNGVKGVMSVGAVDPTKYKLVNPDDYALLPAGGPTLPDDFNAYPSGSQAVSGGRTQ